MMAGFNLMQPALPTPPWRVLVTGDRWWTDAALIAIALEQVRAMGKIEVVIHGAARGADTLAGIEATAMGLRVIACPADWTAHGKAAGPRRNQSMLVDHKPNIVLAFHDNLAESKGTFDMVARARKAGVFVCTLSHNQQKMELPNA